MKRYIDAELAKAQFTGDFYWNYGVPQIKAYIDAVPTADVMPRTKQSRM